MGGTNARQAADVESAAALLQRPGSPAASRRMPWLAVSAGILAATVVALLAVVGWQAHRLNASQHQGAVPAECLHALGGGQVRLGGDFPHEVAPYCHERLVAYTLPGVGPYWDEVELAARSAIDALGLEAAAAAAAAPAPNASAYVFVFDIDETALSNLPLGGAALGDAAAAAAAVAAAPVRRRAEAVGRSSPPLRPVLRLHRALWAAGYSIAFVTGRGEAARADTAANLAAAGYGRACDGGDGAEPLTAAQAAAARARGADPCYVFLCLRPPGEDRLASVYKPWARARLQAAGYELLGNIGDQFSDLAGEHSAPYSFKLPNVWYYIL